MVCLEENYSFQFLMNCFCLGYCTEICCSSAEFRQYKRVEHLTGVLAYASEVTFVKKLKDYMHP